MTEPYISTEEIAKYVNEGRIPVTYLCQNCYRFVNPVEKNVRMEVHLGDLEHVYNGPYYYHVGCTDKLALTRDERAQLAKVLEND